MNADSPGQESTSGGGTLLAGGIAAILASTCCLGPLVLISIGVSGAWIGNLTALEPYRPIFVGIAVIALLLAWRQIWRPAAACEPGQVCAIPRVNRAYRMLFWAVVALAIAAMGFPLIAPWFY
ncbi:MAG: mercuric ion transporter MerT [Burkholderiales bacterium]